jgi:hypothetical protein
MWHAHKKEYTRMRGSIEPNSPLHRGVPPHFECPKLRSQNPIFAVFL